MIDYLIEIAHFIRGDLIVGFGIYTIVNFVFKLLSKRKLVNGFDDAALDTVFILGIAAAVIYIVAFFRLGTTVFALLQPLFWIGISILVRFSKLKRNSIFRLVFCLTFFLTFERIVIILTSLHRDYTPNIWSNDLINESFSFWVITISMTLKLGEFLVASGLVFGLNKVRTNETINKQF